MSDLTYREAINRALEEELASNDEVFLIGEDIAAAGGAFKATDGLLAKFGERRVIDTPISEQAIIGAAIGAAAMGLRPVAEIMFADFAGVCFDQIANQLAKYRYMTNGQAEVPVTVCLANGAGNGFGAQHSQSVENWFLNVPGLKLAVPGTPADAYGLLKAAIRDPDPVLFFQHKNLYGRKGSGPASAGPLSFGQAEIAREGSSVTVVATQLMRYHAIEAADQLSSQGIEAEVIDPRTLVPLDVATIATSIEKTNHLVVVQECSNTGSWGASLLAAVLTECFELLDAPPSLVGGDETPIPHAGPLEAAWMPSPERIATAVAGMLEG